MDIESTGLFWDLPKLPPRKGSGTGSGKDAASKRAAKAGQGLPPISMWGGPPAEFPRIESDEIIAIDIETRDPDLTHRGPGWAYSDAGCIVGVSMAWGRTGKGYWPIQHPDQHATEIFTLDRGQVLGYFSQLLKRSDIKFVVHNAQYDCGWLMKEGVSVNFSSMIDTGILAPLIDEHRKSFSLDTLATWYIGEDRAKDETLLNRAAEYFGFHPKDEMYKLPSKFVGPYAEQDARATLDLYDKLRPLLEKDNQEAVSDIEHRLVPLLVAMRNQGIRIDHDHVQVLEKRWSADIAQTRSKFKIDDEWSAEAVWEVARKRPGVTTPTRTAKTDAPSITKEWLEENAADEYCAAISRIRKVDKLLNTFLRGSLMKYADKVTGRIHPSFNPLRSEQGGTVSGRFSSSNPNVQQVPIRGDRSLAIEIRNCFLPELHKKWCAADYSQQEPRLTLHYGVKIKAPGAKELAAKWWADPTIDYHAMVASLAGVTRSHAKGINLGITYGMGEAALAYDLGLSLEETRLLLRQYYEMLPFIPYLADKIKASAREREYITTFAGRRCRFFGGEKQIHAAVNRLIQGSAADQTKLAMLKLWDESQMVPHVSMHDELCYSVQDAFEGKLIGRSMETAVKLEAPSLVDVAVADNWGAAS